MIFSIQTEGLQYIEDQVSRPQQTWRRQTTVTWRGIKIRTTVERNSYDFQSRIHSEVFSPAELKWNRLQTLEGADHGHLPSAYTKDDAEGNGKILAETQQVVDDLIAYAQQVLGDVAA